MRKCGSLLLVVILLLGSIAFNPNIANASGDYTSTVLDITTVDDIDVYNDYMIDKLTIDNTLPNNKDGGQVYKITLNHDGFISLLLAARNVFKTTTKGGKTIVTEATVTATVYRDAMLLYAVAPQISAKGTTKGESKQKVALDQGTYYISLNTEKYPDDLSSYVKGTAELVIYYQDVNSNELYRPSKVGLENEIKFDNEFVGILTATNPKDYYKFVLDNKALVKFNFMYGSTKNAKFVLYSEEREELVSQPVMGNSVWYNVEKYLEPGTYYCSLETTTKEDGGKTNFEINQTVYPLVLKQVNSKKNTYVTVDTIDDPKEVKCVYGKLTNSELNSKKWNAGQIITENLKFGVNKTGNYTVRVTDEYGNMFMQSIKVNSCDKKAPKKPVVKYYKANNFKVSGTAEAKSEITVKYNGRFYVCNTSSKGNFKCVLPYVLVKGTLVEVTAKDISGNISSKTTVKVK